MLIKVKVEEDVANHKSIKRNKHEVSKVTYKSLGLVEHALEEFLQDNIDILTQEEDYDLMIIGRQIQNNTNKRTDLVALDSNGNIVIIEIKRDEEDMKLRRDNFESQAIRYAASFTKIHTIESLVEKVYARYLVRYKGVGEEDSKKEGIKRIEQFLVKNGSLENFNQDQRIILVASSFDLNVLSASAWLSARGVDISCFEISPQIVEGESGNDYLLEIKRLLPLDTDEDYYTEIINKEASRSGGQNENRGKRKNLPRLADMIEVGIVNTGDEIYFKNKEEDSAATIIGSNEVEFDGKVVTLRIWANMHTHREKTNPYNHAVVKQKGKTLSELRSANYHLFEEMGFDELN